MIATIPLTDIERIQIYINTGKKTLAAIKKETGADYLLNGGFFEAPWKACQQLKADGYVWAQDLYNYYGYAWETGPDIALELLPNNRRNYIACVEMRRGAKPVIPMIYNADVGGYRARSAMGLKDGKLMLYCGAAAMTPEGLRDGLDWDSGVMLDGGGSTQCDFAGTRVESSRVVHHLILVYLTDKRKRFVEAAVGEIGVSEPTGEDKYIRWYNESTGSRFALDVNWCAIFVSWCARQAGVPEGKLPNYASCTTGMDTAKGNGTWRERTYRPRAGDVVIFQNPGTRHTGIVEKADAYTLTTVEGNTGNKVARRTYSLNSSSILGYIAWDGSETIIHTVQRGLNEKYGSGLAIDGSWGPKSRLAMVRAVQAEINRSCGGKLVVDGSWGPKSKAACPDVKRGKMGALVWLLQVGLIVMGYPIRTIPHSARPPRRR